MHDMNCTLCDALAENQRLAMPKKFYNTVLHENEEFSVLPCIGPIVLGHVMVISKKHSCNLASMGKKVAKKYEEIILSIKKSRDLYRDDLLEAEHGSTETDNAGSCIIHTHIHLIPKFGRFEHVFDEKLRKIMTTRKIEHIVKNRRTYILIRGNSNETKVFEPPNVESQYIRKVLFAIEGREDWDWGVFPQKDLILETIRYWQAI